MKPTKEQIRLMQQDKNNYRWGVVYYCKQDPRIIVPKKNLKSGWTLNFAHKQAYVYLVQFILIILIPTQAAIYYSQVNQWDRASFLVAMGTTLCFSIFLLVKLCKSSDRSFEDNYS